MPHISQNKLSNNVLDKLQYDLIKLIVSVNQSKADKFFNEFFTPTEKVMFAKRLAVIILLSEGCSQYKIYNTLKVSPSTVERMSLANEMGRYKSIISYINKNRSSSIVESIFKLISIMPPRIGKDRWKSVRP